MLHAMTAPVSSPALSPQLAAIADELNAVSSGWKSLLSQLPPEKLWQRPAKGGWCVGECIDHLSITNREMLPVLDRLLQNAPSGHEPYRMDLSGRMIVWLMEPPYRMKFKAPTTFAPKPSTKDVLSEFLATQAAALDAVRRCNGVAVDKLKFVSPANARMSYNGYAALKLLPTHQRRHLWQAQQIVKHL